MPSRYKIHNMIKTVSSKQLKRRRATFVALLLLIFTAIGMSPAISNQVPYIPTPHEVLSKSSVSSELAIDALDKLQVKGRAPKTGYTRAQFSDGWADINGCDVRNLILSQQMTNVEFGSDNCVVLSGTLDDPYTRAQINFQRGSKTSSEVQVDHVVALSDAWQKGAQNIDEQSRFSFANDSLNLLAVDGPINQKKGDSDAASWLPPNKSFRCRYVARQIAVKKKYFLWVSEAEYATMKRVLNGCDGQVLPI